MKAPPAKKKTLAAPTKSKQKKKKQKKISKKVHSSYFLDWKSHTYNIIIFIFKFTLDFLDEGEEMEVVAGNEAGLAEDAQAGSDSAAKPPSDAGRQEQVQDSQEMELDMNLEQHLELQQQQKQESRKQLEQYKTRIADITDLLQKSAKKVSALEAELGTSVRTIIK